MEEAKKILGLSSRESILSLKKKFRLKYKKTSDAEKEKLLSAYRLILSLLENYPISLDELTEDPEERLKRRFSEDWLMGRGKR